MRTLYANQKSSVSQSVFQVTSFSTAPLMTIHEPCIQPSTGLFHILGKKEYFPKSSELRSVSAVVKKPLFQWLTSL